MNNDRATKTAEAQALDEIPEVPRKRLQTYRADEVPPTPPDWIQPDWLARDTLHVLAARDGMGKTTAAAYITARLSRGEPLFGMGEKGAPLRCAYLSREESKETMSARLHAAGADLSNILILDEVESAVSKGPWRCPSDCDVLEELLSNDPCDVCIIDGLGHAVEGNGNDYGTVASALTELRRIAEATHTAILGLTHVAKGSNPGATTPIGSTAWRALPRIVWMIGLPDPLDDKKRVLAVAKTNYQPPDKSIAFRIHRHSEDSKIGVMVDVKSCDIAGDVLASAPQNVTERSEILEACELIKGALEDGPIRSRELLDLCNVNRVSHRAYWEARRLLGVVSSPKKNKSGRVHYYEVSLHESVPDELRSVEGTRDFLAKSTEPEAPVPTVSKAVTELDTTKWPFMPCALCGESTADLDDDGRPMCGHHRQHVIYADPAL